MKKYRQKENAKLKVRSLPPTTLHLNYEARELTLRHYLPFFETNYCGSVSYINPSLDMLSLSFCPGYEPLLQYRPNVVDIDLERLLGILAPVRHITISEPAPNCLGRTPLALAVRIRPGAPLNPMLHPKRLPALRTIDYFRRHACRGGVDIMLWVRQCCEPECQELLDDDLSKYTHPDNVGPWCQHVLGDSVEARSATETYRPCEQIIAESPIIPYHSYRVPRPRPVRT